MAKKRSLFRFFKKSDGSNSILLTELDYPEDKEKDIKSDDISEIKLKSVETESPKLITKESRIPQIPIIGIGGCGVRIAGSIASRLSAYGVEYSIMGIETDEKELDKHENISHKFLIPGTTTGTAKQYRKGATLLKDATDELTEAIEEYFSNVDLTYDHEIVFIIMGAGGTGVGAGIEVASILKKIGKRPVPFLILPSKDENTRIKFNSAAALYRFNYAPGNRCLKLVTICIDNEYLLSKTSKSSYSTVISAINERIGAVIGDLLISTELDSDGYSADLNEFLEIFRDIKGIGALSYMHSGGDFSSLTSFFNSKKSISNSIEVDIQTSTRSYYFVQAGKNKVLSNDYRTVLSKFENSDIFPKFVEVEEDDENFEIRGIFTGIKLPQYITDLMQLAEDARVRILNLEIESATEGKGNPKIDRLKKDEEIDVKTGEELAKERSEEYAEKRRSGDIT